MSQNTDELTRDRSLVPIGHIFLFLVHVHSYKMYLKSLKDSSGLAEVLPRKAVSLREERPLVTDKERILRQTNL